MILFLYLVSKGLLASGCLFLAPMPWQGKTPTFSVYVLKLFKIPIFSRNAFTSQYRHLPLLNQIAMPFYLTHQQVVMLPFVLLHLLFQVLVAVLSGALWVPYLSTFPSTLLLATIATFTVSFIITKLGPIR